MSIHRKDAKDAKVREAKQGTFSPFENTEYRTRNVE
jgi:hypothetical protein